MSERELFRGDEIDEQRLIQSRAEAKRDAEQYARFDDILRGAIVGAPAVEDD